MLDNHKFKTRNLYLNKIIAFQDTEPVKVVTGIRRCVEIKMLPLSFSEFILFLLAWYSITTTLFTAILSPVFLNDCIVFFGALGKGMGSLFWEFVLGADSFGQLSSEIQNSIISGIMYWLIAGAVMAILFVITGWLIIRIGYQIGKIYRK